MRWVLQLEELAITGEEHVHPNSWAIGLSALPDSWSNLKRLRTLQLQGHTVLEVGPCMSTGANRVPVSAFPSPEGSF